MRISDWSSDVCSSDLIASLNAVPFLNRMTIVFFLSLALAVIVSLARPARADSNRIVMEGVTFRTTTGFNIAAILVCEIGRAHVLTPVTNAHLVCRLLLEKTKNTNTT